MKRFNLIAALVLTVIVLAGGSAAAAKLRPLLPVADSPSPDASGMAATQWHTYMDYDYDEYGNKIPYYWQIGTTKFTFQGLNPNTTYWLLGKIEAEKWAVQGSFTTDSTGYAKGTLEFQPYGYVGVGSGPYQLWTDSGGQLGQLVLSSE